MLYYLHFLKKNILIKLLLYNYNYKINKYIYYQFQNGNDPCSSPATVSATGWPFVDFIIYRCAESDKNAGLTCEYENWIMSISKGSVLDHLL
jgi:hypothetical protein